MTDDAPDVPIVCTECGTTSRIALDEVAEAIDRHNDRFHDGAAIAEVDPDLKERLADLIIDDLGLLEEDDA